MPWPYCVILTAVQLNSGRAAIKPATTLVLPTLRECPPMTTVGINAASACGFQFSLPVPSGLDLESGLRRRTPLAPANLRFYSSFRRRAEEQILNRRGRRGARRTQRFRLIALLLSQARQ